MDEKDNKLKEIKNFFLSSYWIAVPIFLLGIYLTGRTVVGAIKDDADTLRKPVVEDTTPQEEPEPEKRLTAKISGYVYESPEDKKQVLENASIFVKAIDFAKELKSDKNGYYECELPLEALNELSLKYLKEGYYNLQKEDLKVSLSSHLEQIKIEEAILVRIPLVKAKEPVAQKAKTTSKKTSKKANPQVAEESESKSTTHVINIENANIETLVNGPQYNETPKNDSTNEEEKN